MKRHIPIILIVLVVLSSLNSRAHPSVTQPTQPTTGPGGSDARYTAVTAVHLGDAPTGTWIFSPTRDDVEDLPVVLFMHGFSAVDPETYQAWIDHIVLRGAIVIYPDYQTGNPIEIDPGTYQANAISGIALALNNLGSGSAGPVDLERFAILGHSLGGVLSLNLVALAGEIGLPTPDVLMPVQPGGCSECGGLSAMIGQPFADLSAITAETHVVLVTGDADTVVGRVASEIAWDRLTGVPLSQRDFIELRSDDYGSPPLNADHYSPETGSRNGEVNALDWFGYWKLFDLLTDCAFANLNCESAHGGTSEQLDMGSWSDGTPMNPAIVVESP